MRLPTRTLPFFVLAALPLPAEEFGGIEFPQGAASFADKVTLVSPGSPAATDPNYIDISAATGPPDYLSPTGSYSLGRGGSIILEFTNNRLTGSDSPDPDLHVFEIGPDIEDTFVDVSRDGVLWESLGKVFGSTSSIDIDALGYSSADEFRFVRLTDDPDEGDTTGVTVGADIDAVGALSTSITDDTPVLRIRNAGSPTYVRTLLGEGPAAYWPLNEASGTTATNFGSLGPAADGTYRPHSILDTPGLLANGIDPALGCPFESTQCGMLVGNFAMPTDALSICLSVQSDKTTDTCLFGYGAGSTPNAFSLFATGGNLVVYLNSTRLDFPSIDVMDGDPHNLWITWTSVGGPLQLYLDGELASSITVSDGAPLETGGVFALGQDLDSLSPPNYGFSSAQSFTGTVDEVAIFDKVLPLETVRDIWRSGYLTAIEDGPSELARFFVEFESATGSYYLLQGSPDGETWSDVKGPIEGTGGTIRHISGLENAFLSAYFYRLLTNPD